MKKTVSVYLDERHDKWLHEMALINNRSKSYFISLALEKLIDMTGGYSDGI